MKRLSIRALILGSVLVGACASDEADSSLSSLPDDGTTSFACIQAISSTSLTTGSTVEQARNNLDALIADLSLSSAEVDYFVELRGTLEAMSDTDRLDDVFDSVQCRLR